MRLKKLRILLSSLAVLALATVSNAADWVADFDSPLPASWATAGTLQSGASSPTFVSSISSGVLRLSDTVSDSAGGSFSGFGGTTADIFTDVVVGSDVNVVTDSDDDLGVVARVDLATGDGYLGSIDFELGEACITKVQGINNGVDLVCSAGGSLGTSDSYHMELTATGSSTTDLQLDIYDATGGSLLQSISASDDGSIAGFGAAYSSGVAGVYVVPKGTTLVDASMNTIDGTFDNAFAKSVPEPSASLMLIFAFAGLIGWGRRSR